MTTELDEMQFEILPTEEAPSGTPFGIGFDVSVDDGGFDPGSAAWIVQDGQSPTRGNTQFGRDMLSGPTWSWALHTDMADTAGALRALRAHERAWRGREVADSPTQVLPLRYCMGGETKRVYGRPRAWSGPPSNLILGGFVPITADFKCVDEYTYSDTLSSKTIVATVVAGNDAGSSQGGFVFPVTFPVATLPPIIGGSGANQGAFTVGGDAPMSPIVRITGPAVAPSIVVDSQVLFSLDVSLAAGEWVEVDTRPWHLTVLKNGTASLAGNLGRRQWLSDMTISPGNHIMELTGHSGSSGARATVSWRDTYDSSL